MLIAVYIPCRSVLEPYWRLSTMVYVPSPELARVGMTALRS